MSSTRLLIAACALGCAALATAGEPPPPPRIHHGPMDVKPPGATPEPAPDPGPLLPRPFTAEQICAELTPGLVIDWRITTADGVRLQRWTVADSDGAGATIERVDLDEQGQPAGPPLRRTSSCEDLRDHATYPADRATRDELQGVETPLGLLDGWLYRLREEDEGVVTGFFFARDFPGAPIFARTLHGESLVSEMIQVGRGRSGPPPPPPVAPPTPVAAAPQAP